MKKIIICLIVILYSATAEGETKEKLPYLNYTNIKIALATLFPAYWLHITIHEGTHALTALSYGARIKEFIVWPHSRMIDGKNELSLGRISYTWRTRVTNSERAMVHISPLITNAVLFSASEVLFATDIITSDSYLAPIIFVVGELYPWIDFTKTVLFSRDIEYFEGYSSLPPAAVRITGGIAAALGACALVYRAIQIFGKKRKKEKKDSRVLFHPIIDKDYMGGSAIMRF